MQSGENDLVLPFWDADLHSNSISKSGFPTENMGIWVPQVQVHQTQNQNQNQNHSFQSCLDKNVGFGLANGYRDHQLKENSIKSTRKRSEDNSFAVPQISPTSAALSKRSRTFW